MTTQTTPPLPPDFSTLSPAALATLDHLTALQSRLARATSEAEILATLALALDDPASAWLTLNYLPTEADNTTTELTTVVVWHDDRVAADEAALYRRFTWAGLDLNPMTIESGTLVFVDDIQTQAPGRYRAWPDRTAYRTGVLIPLQSGGQWQGVVEIYGAAVRAFSPLEQFYLSRLLEPLAAAVAGRRADLQRQTTLAETESLYLAGTAISENGEPEAVLKALHRYTVLNRATHLLLFLEPDEAPAFDNLAMVVWSGVHEPFDHAVPPTVLRLLRQQQDIAWVWSGGLPFNSPLVPLRAWLQTIDLAAGLLLPLLVGDLKIGTILALGSADFTASETERRHLQALSTQAAVALQNQQSTHLAQQRAAQLEVLYALSHRLQAALELPEILELVTSSLPLPAAQRITLFTYGRNRAGVVESLLVAADQVMDADLSPLSPQTRYTEGLSTVWPPLFSTTEQFLTDLETQLTAAERHDLPWLDAETRSMVIFPLLVGSLHLGLILVQSASPDAFEDEALAGYRSIMSQVAVAVDNRRLFNQLQDRMTKLKAAAAVSGQLADLFSLDALMQRATETLWRSFNYHRVRLFLSESDDRYLLPGAQMGHDITAETPFDGIAPADSPTLAARAAFSFEPVVLSQAVSDAEAAGLTPQTRSAVAIPLIVAEQFVGVLEVAQDEADFFDDDELRPLLTIADQLAVNVINVRRLEEIRQRATLMENLSEVQTGLSQAVTEAEVLAVVAPALTLSARPALSLGYLDADVHGQPQQLRLTARWVDGQAEAIEDDATSQPLSTLPGSHLWVSTPTDLLVVSDVQQDDRLAAAEQTALAEMQIGALIVVPLYAAGRWQGILSLTWQQAREPDAVEQALLGQLREPITAVVAARRAVLAQQQALEDSQRRAQREETIRQITERMRGAGSLQSLVQITAQELGRRLDVQAVDVALGLFEDTPPRRRR